MTSGGEIWDVLGIAPTDDGRAIRRAYAARLKAIDPETEPETFRALRRAFEEALASELPGTPESAADGEIRSSDPIAPMDPGSLAHRELDDDLDMFEQAVIDGGSDQELIGGIRRIWANAEADNIATAGRIENWLAATVANRLPQLDGLLDTLIERYRWSRYALPIDGIEEADTALSDYVPDAGEIGDEHDEPSPHVLSILTRRDDLYFLASLEHPNHELHDAAEILHYDPKTIEPRGYRHASELRSLIAEFETMHPTAIWNFDAYIVSRWIDWLENEPEFRRIRQNQKIFLGMCAVCIIFIIYMINFE